MVVLLKNFNLNHFMERKYLYLYGFVVIFLPLIFVNYTNELFEFPKMFFLYFFSLLLLLFISYDFLFKGIKLKQVSIPVLLYILTFLISVLFSVHLYTSVWGYYSRFNEALLPMLSMFLFYYVGKSIFSLEDIKILKTLILLPLLPVSIFGIIQHFGLLGSVFWMGNTVDRVYSTFGQPNWLAQYIIMLLPWVFEYAVGKYNQPGYEDVAPFISQDKFWLVLYIISYACMWFTYSLSGLTGFIISGVIFILFLFKHTPHKNFIRKTLIITASCLVISLLFPGIFYSRFHDLLKDIKLFTYGRINIVYAAATNESQMPAVTPLPTSVPTSNDYKISDPGFIRAGMWKGSFSLIFSNIKITLIGTGPETFPYVYYPFRVPSLNYSSEWNYVLNKPHNYLIEQWVEIGLLGLAAYFILFGYLLTKSNFYQLLCIVSFFVSNIFGFPSVVSSFIFWFWLLAVEVEHA
jgi:hypothetical protein